MPYKSIPLGLILVLTLSINCIASDDVEEKLAHSSQPASVERLQLENQALKKQMAAMQATFAQFSEQVQQQETQIEVLAKQPKAEEVAQNVVSIIRSAVLPTTECEIGNDGGQQLTPIYKYIFVKNLIGELNALREKAKAHPGLAEEYSALRNRISELESEIGITEERAKEEKKKREEEQRQRQELEMRLKQEEVKILE